MKIKLFNLLTLAVLISITACSKDDFAENGIDNQGNEIVANFEKEAQESSVLYENLIQSFTPSSPLRNVSDAEIQYPDYYGGGYIDENDNLVIYIKEDMTRSDRDISNIISAKVRSNDFVIRKAEYSYNYLNEIMNALNEHALSYDRNAIFDNINIFYISDRDNAIIVEMENFNDYEIQKFKNVLSDSPAIKFKQGYGKFETQADVNCGSVISDGSYDASLGYRLKIGTTQGFVTAGHFASVGSTIYYGGTSFASCTQSQQSGSIDAAFCKVTNTSYSVTNKIGTTGNTLSTAISEPGVGTVVNIHAKYTKKSGKVLNNNATIPGSSTTYTNMTTVDITTRTGDSGGLYYSYVSSSNTRYTLGVHAGSYNGAAVYSKANAINRAFGSSRY